MSQRNKNKIFFEKGKASIFRIDSEVYYKILISDLTQEWLDESKNNSIESSRKTTDGNYIMLCFYKDKIPVSLYKSSYGTLGLTQEEALAEIDGIAWD